jgi:sigma-B regulation protein RsbU (phosphoserine phosphatase)
LSVVICSVNFWIGMYEHPTGNDQCRWVGEGYSRILISDVVPGGVTDKAGVKDGDYLLRINGKEFKTDLDAQRIINKEVGSTVTYLIERDGRQFETSVYILKLINLAFTALFLYGLGFLFVGFVVVLVKPQGKIQRMFARYSILSMLFFGLTSMSFDPAADPQWLIRTVGLSFLLASFLAPPIFVRFFLFFPIKRRGHASKLLAGALYAMSLALTLMIVLLPAEAKQQALRSVALFGRFAFYLAGFVLFIQSYFFLTPKVRRIQLRPVLIGVVIGIVVFAYVLAIQRKDPLLPFLHPTLLLPVMLLVVVPVFFGYAIFRYRLMDVDLVIRRSLTYGTVTASLAAIYLLMVYGVGSLLSYFFGQHESQVLNVVSLAVIAIVFDPIKQRFQNGVDRLFYRERYDYQRALLEFTQELPRLMEMEHILNSIINRLSSTMHIERIAVVICGEKEGCSSVVKNIDEKDCSFVDGKHSLMALLRKMRGPVDLHLLGDEYDTTEINEPEKQMLLRAGVALAVPMFLQERLVGFINVGPKMSGKVYSQEDITLLSTVAGQAAIAIENARLHKAEIEQQLIKEELDLARKIQQGLFPKANPEMPGLDIAGVSVPALSVGGDYYDFIELGPKKILAVVADVSGKGMSAALYMSKIQGMVQLAAHMYVTPKEMLTNINRRIFEGIDRKSFITMILALFDVKKKEVRICRAGHNKALVGVDGTFRFLKGGGIGLGLERGPVFENAIEEVRLPISPNGLFLFYTDGITEAMNEKRHELGEQAIVNVLKSKRRHSSWEIEQSILTAVEEFRGSAEQHDDVTMVVVKADAQEKKPRG